MLLFRRLVILAITVLFAAACGGAAAPPLTPSSEPSTATAEDEGVISAKLMPPQGDWKVSEVEVKNAKMVSRDGDAPLVLRFERSKPKMGETTVEGADEPIEVTVVYSDKKTREKGQLVYKIAPAPDAKPGESISVTVGQ